jgi:hypothetical protein
MIVSTIEFKDFGGPVFVGRANGAAARRASDLDRLDEVDGEVRVVVPTDTYSVNSSFFLGMFGSSISHFGSVDLFFGHYTFECPAHILNSLRSAAARALSSRGTLALSA